MVNEGFNQVHTAYLLPKAKYMKEFIKMENIVSWEKLEKMVSLSNGPKEGGLAIKMPWTCVLKVLLEITLVGLEKDPATYFDRNVKYENKRKSKDFGNNNKNTKKKKKTGIIIDSDADFVPSVPGPSPGPPGKNAILYLTLLPPRFHA